MNIELTPQQQQVLDTQEGGPPRVMVNKGRCMVIRVTENIATFPA